MTYIATFLENSIHLKKLLQNNIISVITFFISSYIGIQTYLGVVYEKLNVVDLIVYQHSIKSLSIFRLENSIRGIDNIFGDHQEFLLFPLSFILSIHPILIFIASPFFLIFLPFVLMNKLIKMNKLQQILVVSILILHPFTMNSIFSFFKTQYLLPSLLLGCFIALERKKIIIFILLFLASLMTKEDSIIWASLMLFQYVMYKLLFKKENNFEYMGYAFSLALFYGIFLFWFRSKFQLVNYSIVESFSYPEDLRDIQVKNYMTADLWSFFSGNIVGALDYLARLSNSHTLNPIYHHGYLAPFLTAMTFSFIYEYKIIRYIALSSFFINIIINLNTEKIDYKTQPPVLYQKQLQYEWKYDDFSDDPFIATELSQLPKIAKTKPESCMNIDFPVYPPVKKEFKCKI